MKINKSKVVGLIGISLLACAFFQKRKNSTGVKEDYGYRIKKFMSKIQTDDIWKIITDKDMQNDLRIQWRYGERKVSYGEENPDKTYYVIRHSTIRGIFSLFNHSISHLFYAEENGYIPVFDEYSMINFMNDSEIIGKKNAWDIFFEQPAGVLLEDIANSKNVILSDAIERPVCKRQELNWINYRFGKDARYWNKIYNKYYIFNKQTKEYFEDKYAEVFGDKKGVIGVAVRRGIAYSMAVKGPESKGHPIEFTLEKIIQIAKSKIKNYNYVFCITDDEETLNIFKEEFRTKLLYVERERYQLFVNGEVNKNLNKVHDRYQYTLSYMTEIFLLSKCDMLVAGRNGGSIAADIFNNGKYEEVIITTRKKLFDGGAAKLSVEGGVVKIIQKN